MTILPTNVYFPTSVKVKLVGTPLRVTEVGLNFNPSTVTVWS